MATWKGRGGARRTALIAPVAIALVCGLGISSGGCRQPSHTQTGFRLEGKLSTAPVRNWSFTDEIDEVFLETTPWYLVPHSTTIWCASLEGRLFVGSSRDRGKKRWEQNAERNPDGRLRVLGKVYDVTIRPVEDDATALALDAAFATKYPTLRNFSRTAPKWWYYEIFQRR